MIRLSKSKLIAFRQCPKRLWLEVNRPELAKISAASQRAFDIGHTVGHVAQRLYAPDDNADLIEVRQLGHERALRQTRDLVLAGARPIFEAGFSAEGALAYADVLLPVKSGHRIEWRMVEVKSSTSVKDYHVADASIQAYLARASGLPLASISVATIDSKFVYPGDERYEGLLKETDLTEESLRNAPEVAGLIPAARAVAEAPAEPTMRTGRHCTDPFECGFVDYCASQETKAEFPVAWLPNGGGKALKELLSNPDVRDMRDVPDALLNDRQRRVKRHTIENEPFLDAGGALEALAHCPLPVHALDFETIAFAVPVWRGTRPYAAIPFQFSFHSLFEDGRVEHKEFLDLTGEDPARRVAEALVRDCSGEGPILTYTAYERTQLDGLAARFSDLADELNAISARLFDLYPVAKEYFYHPSQEGSWSIKKVLPALVGQGYTDLAVAGGQAAMDAYLEAINPQTSPQRVQELRGELLDYCGLDTRGLLLVWRAFAGRNDLVI